MLEKRVLGRWVPAIEGDLPSCPPLRLPVEAGGRYPSRFGAASPSNRPELSVFTVDPIPGTYRMRLRAFRTLVPASNPKDPDGLADPEDAFSEPFDVVERVEPWGKGAEE